MLLLLLMRTREFEFHVESKTNHAVKIMVFGRCLKHHHTWRLPCSWFNLPDASVPAGSSCSSVGITAGKSC